MAAAAGSSAPCDECHIRFLFATGVGNGLNVIGLAFAPQSLFAAVGALTLGM